MYNLFELCMTDLLLVIKELFIYYVSQNGVNYE